MDRGNAPEGWRPGHLGARARQFAFHSPHRGRAIRVAQRGHRHHRGGRRQQHAQAKSSVNVSGRLQHHPLEAKIRQDKPCPPRRSKGSRPAEPCWDRDDSGRVGQHHAPSAAIAARAVGQHGNKEDVPHCLVDAQGRHVRPCRAELRACKGSDKIGRRGRQVQPLRPAQPCHGDAEWQGASRNGAKEPV